MEFEFKKFDLCEERTSEGKVKLYLFFRIEGDQAKLLEYKGFFGEGEPIKLPAEELTKRFVKVYRRVDGKDTIINLQETTL